MYQIYFILEWHSTCFGRSLRPSPAVEDCTYCNRHLSNRYSCLLADIQTAVSVTVRLDTVSHVTARNMGHVAIQHRLYLCQFMSLTSVVLMDSHSATQLPCCLLHQLYRKGVLFSLTVQLARRILEHLKCSFLDAQCSQKKAVKSNSWR